MADSDPFVFKWGQRLQFNRRIQKASEVTNLRKWLSVLQRASWGTRILEISETWKVAFSCKTSQCWQSVCMKHYQSGCLKTTLAANYCCMQITTDKNKYKGFEARSWVENVKWIFFILPYCLTTYRLSQNAPAQWGKFHSPPPLSGENKHSFLLQWSEKKPIWQITLFIYLFNKSAFNLVEFPHPSQNRTTSIQTKW